MDRIKYNPLTDNYIIKSLIRIILIIILGSVMVYGINTQFSRSAYFLFVLLWFFLTKDIVLGVAVLFILAIHPWGLFYYRPDNWIIKVTATVGVNYKAVLPIIIFVKYLFQNSIKLHNVKNYFRKFYIVFLIYLLFLVVWGFVYGHSIASIFDLIINISGYFLFFLIPVAFDREKSVRLNSLLLSFFLLHTLITIADIFLSGAITQLMIFGRAASTAAAWTEEIIRLTGGIGLALYSLVISFSYLANREKRFHPTFLWLCAGLAVFYIINSATRGWMIATFFLVLSYFVYYIRHLLKRKTVINVGFLVVMILVGAVLFTSKIQKNMISAFDRLATVEAIAEGDLTAEGTARRWDIRGPRVLSHFNESPVFGFGFSKTTTEYYDGHVGNHSLLLIGGFTGFAVVWITIITIVIYLYKLDRRIKKNKGIFVFGLGLIAIMIIHSTSRAMVSFMMPVDVAFIISLMFSHVNAVLNDNQHSLKQI